MTVRLLLADDHIIMREGLKLLLSKAADIEVVAEASNGREAVALADELRPDLIVMDLNMPVMGGIEATRCILASDSSARIIVLSMLADRDCVSESLKLGVKGYLLKDCAAGELLAAIRAVAAGVAYLGSIVTDTVISDYSRLLAGDSASQLCRLSRREQEVLRLMAEGLNTKEVAFQLNVSTKTIETQRASLMKKLELYSVAELTRFAVRHGLVTVV
ncbi:MAG TPA: response regulator transcription factor [Deltaproteobacteria bacterium]|nr:response regulator transcription factor [Deltaproteobacteria bacterium]HQB38054.1 response regulator transcription factor [Deltaproteobacteria bacterium]